MGVLPRHNGAQSPPAGHATAIGDEDVTIVLNGGAVSVRRMRGDGAKIGAAKFAKQAGLAASSKLLRRGKPASRAAYRR